MNRNSDKHTPDNGRLFQSIGVWSGKFSARILGGVTKSAGPISSAVAIVIGLLVGLIVLIISNPSKAFDGLGWILGGSLQSSKDIGNVFYFATPIIMTGLSVAFAFRTSLFNIGASGQFIMGAFGAVLVGVHGTALGSFQWVAALLAALLFGALWAVIPGVLQAYRNVNVVISCIMTNYIGMYLVNMLVKATVFDTYTNRSMGVAPTANIPKLGLDKLFPGSSINGGILIAILFAVLLYILLNKTTFGYELKACGFNRHASRYAGINEKKAIVLSMVISGAMAGVGGGLLYLAGSGKYIAVEDVLAVEGFAGISVALLGMSHPIGTLFAGLFVA
ncbi:MAG: ABC transporter permease, partial [Bacillota bacterium]